MGVVVNEYSITFINLERIHYLWEAPLEAGIDERYIQAGKNGLIARHYDWETNFFSLDSALSVRRIYNSINKIGLVNPLIVKEFDGQYYTVIGNQRLTCLRVMKFNTVPCIIAKITDGWGNNTEAVVIHPNELVE